MPGTEDNMVKLVVCDIDGTLLGKDQIQLEGDAAKALGALIESGKKVALASGRSYFSMRKVVSSQPVSYTHLDVYKRQYQWRTNCLITHGKKSD